MLSSEVRAGQLVEFRAYSALFGDAAKMQTIQAVVLSHTKASALVGWEEVSPNRLLVCRDRIKLKRLKKVGFSPDGTYPELKFNTDPED